MTVCIEWSAVARRRLRSNESSGASPASPTAQRRAGRSRHPPGCRASCCCCCCCCRRWPASSSTSSSGGAGEMRRWWRRRWRAVVCGASQLLHQHTGHRWWARQLPRRRCWCRQHYSQFSVLVSVLITVIIECSAELRRGKMSWLCGWVITCGVGFDAVCASSAQPLWSTWKQSPSTGSFYFVVLQQSLRTSVIPRYDNSL